jgi:hypothetical protein
MVQVIRTGQRRKANVSKGNVWRDAEIILAYHEFERDAGIRSREYAPYLEIPEMVPIEVEETVGDKNI